MTSTSIHSPISAARELKTRIASIDIYRGIVMFLMLAEMLHLYKLKDGMPADSWYSKPFEWLAFHTTHVAWRGCSLHDMIQPSFTFLVGAAMAFSLTSRSQSGQSWSARFGHALWRSVVLVFLGIFLRSLGKNDTNFTFDDTLTQIGLGYWILFLLSNLTTRSLVAALILILLGYWLAFVMYPAPAVDFPYSTYGVPETWKEHATGIASHFNKNSNLAWAVDRWWMNLFYREKPFAFSSGGYATLSFIPTLGTMLLGLLAGRVLLAPIHDQKKQQWLWGLGLVCLAVAWSMEAIGLCPIVKRIWTPSWVLWSGGICFMALALLNAICDMANSIAAYVMSWTLEDPIQKAIDRHFGWLITRLDSGLQSLLQVFLDIERVATTRPLLIGMVTLAVIWLVLHWMYRRKLFIKI
jgi:heparan-alpha-glucosaminide N-acetyltransferase